MITELPTLRSTSPSEKPVASMSEVVMRKSELLERLIENKAKHDIVLATAISGYWTLAKERIQAKRKKLQEQVVEYAGNCELEFARLDRRVDNQEQLPSHVKISMLSLDTNLDLVYPQDHSRDYERAIRMMEASIYEEVQLSVNEFDSYVLNNWEWKDSFLAASMMYGRNVTGCYSSSALMNLSGCAIKLGTGYQDIYARSVNKVANTFLFSGVNANTF